MKKRESVCPLTRQIKFLILAKKISNLNPCKSMKKFRDHFERIQFEFLSKKTIRVMKLTLFLSLLTISQLWATETYSQMTKLSLKLEDVKISDVLTAIENHSEFFFLYSPKLIDVERKVNIDVKEEPIKDILPEIFGKDVKFAVYDRQIILTPNESPAVLSPLQQQLISGTVTDESGNPMPGVNVKIEGTTLGIITDINGKYSIEKSSDDAVLVFSFIGYITQKASASGKTVIDIKLAQTVRSLEEVVVIGYGTTVQKRDLTGSVSSIQGNSVSERKTIQVSQALQGAMPGLMVTRDNNEPGSAATIRIRGITTIGTSDPLIIVDGVPTDDINNVDPNDVENISVLKDAASASIYGSRAASGVILVTTKRAKSGQLGLEYNMEYGFEKPTELPENVDVVRYLQIVNELRWNDNNNNANEYPIYTKDIVDNYLSLNKTNPDLYPNTNWAKLILKDNAPRQSHILSITAGTESIRTRLSVDYDKTDGLYMNKSYERITTRFNNDITINKFLSTSVDFFIKRSISKQPFENSNDIMWWAFVAAPVYAAEWSDGGVGEGKTGENIYPCIKYGGFNNDWNTQLGGKVSIDLKLFKGFKLSAIISPNFGFDKSKLFCKKIEYYAYDDPTLLLGTIGGHTNTDLYENRNDNYNVTGQLLANYIKSFGKHSINMMVGYEDYYAFYENMGASRQQFDLSSFPYLNLGPLGYRDNSGSAWENAYRSYFGRVMYNYKDKYLLQGNIRYDGSSRFNKNYRWGAFPSLSAGWVISEESFIKDNKILPYLKLRGSWGTLGNERIGNYPYQATIAFSNALFYQGSTIISAQTAAQARYAIPDISWETTNTIDFGVDAGFFNNKLRFTGDYYLKKTKDMLLALQIPIYMGFDNPDQNTGIMKTKGWETELGWNDQIGDLKYSVSFNLSDFKSTMGDLGGTEFIGDQIIMKGSEFNEWYGYKSAGLFQTQTEVDNSPKLSASTKPGDVKYKDISGPNGVPDGIISPDYDRTLLGGSLPRYLFGGNIRLDYKNFDFLIVFQGVGKQNARLSDVMVQPIANNWGAIPKILDGNYYSNYNTAEKNLTVKYPRMSWSNLATNYAMSDYWLFNGAYARLKNITIGYNIPEAFTQKLKIQSLRVYSSISDLFSINSYPKGWDPEVATTGYPITTSFIFGLSVKF
jgi:TonB-linked SusC/RagA family outer membrane protein